MTTLNEVLEQSWQLLQDGASQADHPFHEMALGTTNPANQCDLRTVILRAVDVDVAQNRRWLICHSDVRAQKVADIRANPQTCWLFYDTKQRIQLRIYGQTTIHTTDGFADEQWGTIGPFTRRMYCATHRHGEPFDYPYSGLPDDLQDRAPTESEMAAARQKFAVIRCQVDCLDWLWLKTEGHQRAMFRWSDAGTLQATWVSP